jgi:hypothetical protein
MFLYLKLGSTSRNTLYNASNQWMPVANFQNSTLLIGDRLIRLDKIYGLYLQTLPCTPSIYSLRSDAHSSAFIEIGSPCPDRL